jgi:RNA polymerase subunit RPABC4/transcription elongation factor Spt4
MRLSVLWAYLTPAQRPSAHTKLCLGWRGLQQVVEPTESVVAQQLVAAKRGGFSQHSWGWQMIGHATQKNLATL